MYSLHGENVLPLFCTLTAIVLLNKFNVDAQQFPTPGVLEDKYGNRSGSVDFVWTYTTPDLSKTNIYCGISKSTVVQKRPGTGAAIQSAFVGKADVIDVTTGSPYQIGFKLKNLAFTDANSYFCTMIYDSGAALYSKSYVFKIYVRPVFASCLADGIIMDTAGVSYFGLREDGVLNSTCYVYGNPVPTLVCKTYDTRNIEQASLQPTRNLGKNNFTSIPLNERMLFFNVKRAVTKVKCVADGGPTGKVSIERAVRVDYLASAPIGITLVASTTQSIRITWKPPQQPGISRITDYFMELNHPNGTITTTNYTVLSVNPVLDYTFSNLFGNQKYTIYVSAYNAVGRGARSVAASFTTVYYTSGASARTNEDISDGAIFALIVGLPIGIMLLLIIAYNVRKKMKEEPEYPEDYVEETVDYQPADSGLYAQVNKKKLLIDANENASEYPFTIHQVNRSYDGEKLMMQGDVSSMDDPQSPTSQKQLKENF